MELMVSSAISTMVMLGVYYLYTNSLDSGVLASNNQIRNNILGTYDSVLLRNFRGIATLRFNPNQTYVGNLDTGIAKAGTVWEMADGDKSRADVKEFCFDGKFYQDSHRIDSFIVKECNTGERRKVTQSIYLSRCVDGRVATIPNTYNEINRLRKPTLIVNSLGERELHCCRNGSACPGANSEKRYFWPTIFIYKGEGNVTTIPALNERSVMPGVGFMVVFDSKRQPSQASLVGIFLENHCKISKFGFIDARGNQRSPNRCADTRLAAASRNFYDSDLRVVWKVDTRPVVAGLSGSGFLDMAGLVVKESETSGLPRLCARPEPSCTP